MTKKPIDSTAATPSATRTGQRAAARAPKRVPKTKKAQILALLTRKRGASLTDLTAATGWQAHSVRAALTGLRKRGTIIDRRTDAAGSRYRIIAPQMGATS
jgi:DNA-binding MarR family transcriptional regulator